MIINHYGLDSILNGNYYINRCDVWVGNKLQNSKANFDMGTRFEKIGRQPPYLEAKVSSREELVTYDKNDRRSFQK